MSMEFYDAYEPVARKTHKCEMCGEPCDLDFDRVCWCAKFEEKKGDTA